MGNMSYCRFENTAEDLKDCVQAIYDGEHFNLDVWEFNGLKSLIHNARIIAEIF